MKLFYFLLLRLLLRLLLPFPPLALALVLVLLNNPFILSNIDDESDEPDEPDENILVKNPGSVAPVPVAPCLLEEKKLPNNPGSFVSSVAPVVPVAPPGANGIPGLGPDLVSSFSGAAYHFLFDSSG